MIKPFKKYDCLLGRDLTAAERLEPARARLQIARRLLEQAERMLSNASDQLTEAQLETLCMAAEQVVRAVENMAFIGTCGFEPYPLERVVWTEE